MHSLHTIITQNKNLHNLLQWVDYWRYLESQLKQHIPQNLRDQCRVVCIRDNTLVVHTDSASSAMRLKMILPAVLPQMQDIDKNIHRFQVKHKPTHPQPHATDSHKISPTTLDKFEHTAQQLSHHTDLAHAIMQLVKHQR